VENFLSGNFPRSKNEEGLFFTGFDLIWFYRCWLRYPGRWVQFALEPTGIVGRPDDSNDPELGHETLPAISGYPDMDIQFPFGNCLFFRFSPMG